MGDLTATRVLRAELTGADQCVCEDVHVRAAAPVLEICRKLVAAGYDPSLPLEAYRGETFCLRVRSIGAAAKLEINGSGVGFRQRRVGHSPVQRANDRARTPAPENSERPISGRVPA